jgi:hypothetical protein
MAAIVNSFSVNETVLNDGGSPAPAPSALSPYSVNGAPLNVYPINGPNALVVPGMTVEVVDCRNLIVNFTVGYDHFRALKPNNWGLSLGGFVNAVRYIEGDSYAVNTSRCFAGVVYTLTADV